MFETPQRILLYNNTNPTNCTKFGAYNKVGTTFNFNLKIDAFRLQVH